MRSFCMVEVCREPGLVDLAFAKFGWGFGGLGEGIFPELREPWGEHDHFRWVGLARLLFLHFTFFLRQSAEFLELFGLVKTKTLVRCWFPSARCHGGCLIVPHLYPCNAPSAIAPLPSYPIHWLSKRTSLAALALSLFGTLFTL